MTRYRIHQDEWKRHDFRKLVGLLLLLAAAVISWFLHKPKEDSDMAMAGAAPSPAASAPAQPSPSITPTPVPAGEVAFTMDEPATGGSIKVGDNLFRGKAKEGEIVVLKIDKFVCGMTKAGADNTWTIKRFVHEGNRMRDIRALNRTTSETTAERMIDVQP
ncbi:MAG: hypothetical protein JST35_07135 [Armatimonadetes bacterium]|nr:hypothetical protein [Armatimonadota bacterium]